MSSATPTTGHGPGTCQFLGNSTTGPDTTFPYPPISSLVNPSDWTKLADDAGDILLIDSPAPFTFIAETSYESPSTLDELRHNIKVAALFNHECDRYRRENTEAQLRRDVFGLIKDFAVLQQERERLMVQQCTRLEWEINCAHHQLQVMRERCERHAPPPTSFFGCFPVPTPLRAMHWALLLADRFPSWFVR